MDVRVDDGRRQQRADDRQNPQRRSPRRKGDLRQPRRSICDPPGHEREKGDIDHRPGISEYAVVAAVRGRNGERQGHKDVEGKRPETPQLSLRFNGSGISVGDVQWLDSRPRADRVGPRGHCFKYQANEAALLEQFQPCGNSNRRALPRSIRSFN